MAPTRDPRQHVRRAAAYRRSGWMSAGAAVAVLAAGVLVPAGYACAVYGVDAVSAAVGRRAVVTAAYAVLLVAAAVLVRGLLIGGGGRGDDVEVAVFAVLFGIPLPVLVNVVFLLGGDPAARDVTALDGYLVVAAIGALVMAIVLSVRLRIALAREDTPG